MRLIINILGNRVLRKEDPRFLRGEGRYVENLPLEDALTITFVRSLFAHARIGGIDATAAAALPGVQVITGADLDIGPIPPPPFPGLEQGMSRPLVAIDTVRFVGDIVAIVLSEGRAAGADAAELVVVDYDPLPAVVRPADAAKDEALVFPDVGTNVAARSVGEHDDTSLRLRGRRLGHEHQPAFGGVPARAALGRRRVGPDSASPRGSRRTPHQDRMVSRNPRARPADLRVVAPTSAAASARR